MATLAFTELKITWKKKLFFVNIITMNSISINRIFYMGTNLAFWMLKKKKKLEEKKLQFPFKSSKLYIVRGHSFPFKTFYTVPPHQPSTLNPPISSDTPISSNLSHCYIYFRRTTATITNHLNSDQAKLNPFGLFFYSFCYAPHWLALLLRMTFWYRIVKEEKFILF